MAPFFFYYSIQDAVLANNIRILKLLVAVPGSFAQRDLDLALIAAAKHGKLIWVSWLPLLTRQTRLSKRCRPRSDAAKCKTRRLIRVIHSATLATSADTQRHMTFIQRRINVDRPYNKTRSCTITHGIHSQSTYVILMILWFWPNKNNTTYKLHLRQSHAVLTSWRCSEVN